MPRYQEFCESLKVGKARTEEELLRQEDKERTLPLAVGEIVQRMCAAFQVPADRVRYMDSPSRLPTGTLSGGAPLLQYHPEKGRYSLDVEIGVGDRPEEAPDPVWLHLECVPLEHGGLEFRFESAIFQLPDEEGPFFDQVAAAINRDLRAGYTPGPRRIGW